MAFPQKLLAEDEQLVLVLRRHIKVLTAPFLVLSAVVTAVAVPAVLTDATTWPVWVLIAVAVLAGLVLAVWVVAPFVVWRTTVYVITTRRLIQRAGVFARSGHDMPLTRLNDVSFQHSFIERLLGCGSLIVESAGERGQLRLTDIPKVELVQRTLYRLADDLRPQTDRTMDPRLAQQLDDAFDEEYHGPQGTDTPAEPDR